MLYLQNYEKMFVEISSTYNHFLSNICCRKKLFPENKTSSLIDILHYFRIPQQSQQVYLCSVVHEQCIILFSSISVKKEIIQIPCAIGSKTLIDNINKED